MKQRRKPLTTGRVIVMNIPSIINPAHEAATMRNRMVALIEVGLSLQRIAVETSVKRFDLQAWLDGRCLDDSVQVRIADWLQERDSRAGEWKEPTWVQTPTSQKIHGALAYAQTTPTIALIYGGAGVSKTTTALRYVADEGKTSSSKWDGFRSQPQTFYVSAAQWIRTPVAILQQIAEAVGTLTEHAYRNNTLAKAILRVLQPGDLLIVDEAQNLDPAALDGIRYFHDEGGIGIAYLGNEEVYTRINGRTRRAAFAQLSSRIGKRLHIELPHADDVDAILEAWGIGGRKELEFAHNVALRPGGLRDLAQVLRYARVLSTGLGKPVDARIMKASATSLGLQL
jgi:DNA transposition AAA+ family ATPase